MYYRIVVVIVSCLSLVLIVVGSLWSIQTVNPLQSLEEEEEFQQWLLEKKKINENIEKVCKKYGPVARKWFIRNTKIKVSITFL